MIRCLLLLAVSAAALGQPQDDSANLDPTLTKNVCYFGRPSRQCLTKCQELEKDSACHETSGLCICKDKPTPVSIHVKRVETPAENKQEAETEHQDVSSLQIAGTDEFEQPTPLPTLVDDMVIPMKDYCFFGEYPSLACKSKCSHQSTDAKVMVAYCQDDARDKTCLCREKTEEDAETAAAAPTPDISDYCWFGQFPSTACHDKCGESEAFCDQRHCLCRSKSTMLLPLEQAPAQIPEEQEDSGANRGVMHTMLVFVRLNDTSEDSAQANETPTTQGEDGESPEGSNSDFMHKIITALKATKSGITGMFSNKTAPEQTSAIPTTLAPATLDQVQPTQGQVQPHTFWDYQHMAALAIASLVAFLILLELYSFYKKRKASQSLQTVFKTMPNQNQSINKS